MLSLGLNVKSKARGMTPRVFCNYNTTTLNWNGDPKPNAMYQSSRTSQPTPLPKPKPKPHPPLTYPPKVTSPAEGKVGLEFPDDSQIDGALTTDDQINLGGGDGGGGGADGPRRTSPLDGTGTTRPSDDEDDEDTDYSDDGDDDDDNFGNNNNNNGAGAEEVASNYCSADDPLVQVVQLRSMAPDATTLARVRRRVPVVGPAGHQIMTTTSSTRGRVLVSSQHRPGAAAAAAAQAPPRNSKDNASYDCGDGDTISGTTGDSVNVSSKASHGAKSTGSLETAETASRGKTRDMVVQVYWEGAARDRAYIEVYPAKMESGGRGRGGTGTSAGNHISTSSRRCLRLGVRVPTLAIVDAQAAAKFAERVAQQVAIEVVDDGGGSMGAGKQQSTTRLRLGGVDAKAVVAGS